MEHIFVPHTDYEQKEKEAIRQFRALLAQDQAISLKKDSRHTFKNRRGQANLDLRHFSQVLSIDTESCLATVEGMTTFYDLVDAALPLGPMPQVVPELRSITVGGVMAGLGGQSSSFKFGLVHETVTSFDLLTGEGTVVHCSPESNPELFYMLPNSYGSLGYVLKCDIRLTRIAPYVRVRTRRFSNAEAFFEAMDEEVRVGNADFVEGVSFSASDFILLIGDFARSLPPNETPLIPLRQPFFMGIQDQSVSHHLATRDYIWRWDPDAFWATDQKNIIGSLLLNPRFRRTFGRFILRSDRLIKIGKLRNRLRQKGLAKYLFLEEKRKEALIQDAAIPFEQAASFDAWLSRELHIYPLWYCPVRTIHASGTYPLYKPGSEFVVDFGFYVSMALEDHQDDYYYNRRIEEKLMELGAFKCLYSDTFFSPEQFWSLYDKERYDAVRSRYDPNGTFPNLYDKVVNQDQFDRQRPIAGR